MYVNCLLSEFIVLRNYLHKLTIDSNGLKVRLSCIWKHDMQLEILKCCFS